MYLVCDLHRILSTLFILRRKGALRYNVAMADRTTIFDLGQVFRALIKSPTPLKVGQIAPQCWVHPHGFFSPIQMGTGTVKASLDELMRRGLVERPSKVTYRAIWNGRPPVGTGFVYGAKHAHRRESAIAMVYPGASFVTNATLHWDGDGELDRVWLSCHKINQGLEKMLEKSDISQIERTVAQIQRSSSAAGWDWSAFVLRPKRWCFRCVQDRPGDGNALSDLLYQKKLIEPRCPVCNEALHSRSANYTSPLIAQGPIRIPINRATLERDYPEDWQAAWTSGLRDLRQAFVELDRIIVAWQLY